MCYVAWQYFLVQRMIGCPPSSIPSEKDEKQRCTEEKSVDPTYCPSDSELSNGETNKMKL
jgi:hypothetical protein